MSLSKFMKNSGLIALAAATVASVLPATASAQGRVLSPVHTRP